MIKGYHFENRIKDQNNEFVYFAERKSSGKLLKNNRKTWKKIPPGYMSSVRARIDPASRKKRKRANTPSEEEKNERKNERKDNTVKKAGKSVSAHFCC